MKKSSIAFVLIALVLPTGTTAQEVSATAQSSNRSESAAQQQSATAAQPQGSVERAVRRFRIGVSGGVAFDPELINFGGHAAFGPVFTPALEVRPGVEFGLGEVTTLFGINVDVLYRLPGGTADTRWVPYLGGGPNFALSNRDLDFDDDDGNRFDFSDTDFTGGFNFIAGARNQGGLFFELKATAWGVSNVRLLAGFNF